MKRISVIVCLLAAHLFLFLPVGCVKNSNVKTGSEAKGPSPAITFEKNVFDFGEVGVNTKRTEEIQFSNTGEARLEITDVNTCCGVSIKFDKMELAPGESGTMKMEWTAKSNPAPMMWRITVHSNDRANPKMDLIMQATLVHRIACEPPRLRLFLEEENAGCPSLTIRSLDDQPFSITGLKSTADCITVEFDPSVEAKEFVLAPKVDLAKLQENLQGRLSFELSHPEGRDATVLFDVFPRYTISPQLLIIFGAEPGKPTVKKIEVISNFGQSTEVESVSSKGKAIAVRMLGQKEIKNGYELEVEVTPMAPIVEGKTVYTDTFFLNLKDGKTLPVDCNAYYSARRTRTQARSEAM